MRRKLKPLLSALLTIAMLLSLLPTAVFAKGETGTFTKITTQEELTNGKYVMAVNSGYAVGEYNNGNAIWLLAYSITPEAEKLINPDANLVWEIAVTDSGVTLTDANGVQVAPSGGNNNGIKAGDYTWATSFENGTFRFLGTGEDTVTLASNKQSDYKFRAYKNTTINAGYPCDFTLYQYVEGTGTTDPDPGEDTQPGESPIQAGDSVVIYAPDISMALSSNVISSYYPVGVEVTFADNTLTGYENTEVWTVGGSAEDGWTFTSNSGNALSMGDSFASTYPGAGSNKTWALEATEIEGQYYLKNEGRGNYLLWDVDHTDWTTNNSSKTAVSFYVVTGDTPEPEPEGATLVATPADGDIVVIYYPASSKVMGTESYTYASSGGSTKDELVAVGGTLNEDLLTVPEGAAEFRVHVDENGHYTFQSDAGYLYLDGTHVRLVAEQGEYTLFDLEAQESGSFIKSTNAQVSDKAQYLEYYGGYFTCYGMGSNTDIYTFQFYKTGTFNPGTGPVHDGDQIVIYNPDSGMALSSEAAGTYYRAGKAFNPETDANKLTQLPFQQQWQ